MTTSSLLEAAKAALDFIAVIGYHSSDAYAQLDAAIAAAQAEQSASVDTVPWPKVEAYPGGASPEGLGAWVDVRLGDGPETTRFYRAQSASVPPSRDDLPDDYYEPRIAKTPLPKAQSASVPWECACGANLFIDADGSPRSKAVQSASATSVQPVAWVSVEDQMPDSGVIVLACYTNRLGNVRRIRAQWIAAKSSEANIEYSDHAEYDEATDCYYDPEGWYERIDNWDDCSAVFVSEGLVTHWMPLPAAPTPAQGEKP